MKADELREMNTTELQEKVAEFQRHLFDLRTQSSTEKLEDTRSMRNSRREIARAKTVLRQRELSGQ